MSPQRTASTNPQDGTGSPPQGEPVFLVVGKLRRPHGVEGEMLMDVETDFPERLHRGRTVYVGSTRQAMKLRTIRKQNRALLVSFDGYDDCDQVGILRNQLVYVRTADLPRLPEGEYYHHELIGLRVVDEQSNELGLLTEILETGANDVYVVTSVEGEELLLPVIDSVILSVDLEKHVMTVNPPEWS